MPAIKHLPLTAKYFLDHFYKLWCLRYESSELHWRSKEELEEPIDRPWISHCMLTTVMGCRCGKISVHLKLGSLQMQLSCSWLFYFCICFVFQAVWLWRLITVTFSYSATKEDFNLLTRLFWWWWWRRLRQRWWWWFSAKKAIRHTTAKS